MSLISQLFGDETYGPLVSMADAPTDWKETPDAHEFIVDLPGLKKEEVKVEVEDGRMLKISGERNEEKDDKDKWHKVERCQGTFTRRFRLPENAKTEEVKASMENGVLKVTVSKQKVKKPEKKVIEIEEIKGRKKGLLSDCFKCSYAS